MNVQNPRAQAGHAEFIARMAFLMAMVALGIDAMLPALGPMAVDLGVAGSSDIQMVISAMFLGLSAGLIFYGPFADSFGRKKAIYIGGILYIAGSLVGFMSHSLPMMLAGRVLQGTGAAASRVISIAMVRDCFSGREMARVMSFIMMIFIMVPALAPSLGQGIMHLTHWRGIFMTFVVLGIMACFWIAWRQPETLAPEHRRPFSVKAIAAGAKETLRNKVSMTYAVAAGLAFGAFIGYLTSVQPMFQELYGLGDQFPLYFGGLALAIGLSSSVNAKLVIRHGMERISFAAVGVLCSVAWLFLGVAALYHGQPPLPALLAFLSVCFLCFGMLFSNYNTLALGPMAHLAGLANSVISSLQTFISVICGGLIGSLYNNTVYPTVLGFAVLATLAFFLTFRIQRSGS